MTVRYKIEDNAFKIVIQKGVWEFEDSMTPEEVNEMVAFIKQGKALWKRIRLNKTKEMLK